MTGRREVKPRREEEEEKHKCEDFWMKRQLIFFLMFSLISFVLVKRHKHINHFEFFLKGGEYMHVDSLKFLINPHGLPCHQWSPSPTSPSIHMPPHYSKAHKLTSIEKKQKTNDLNCT